MQKGTLYLIPSALGETSAIDNVIPAHVKVVADTITHFFVENEKSARQFLKKLGIKTPLQEIQLYPINEHTDIRKIDFSALLKPIMDGLNMGVLSDAGCPGIADPGADVVHAAHERNIRVVPMVGPSSIFLALMASGFNGQSFSFHGYLPRERAERIKKIKELESESQRKKQTQIFIETPYRNQHMIDDLMGSCDRNTQLCIAADITLPSEFIAVKSIQEWKKQVPQINKRPAIFLLYKVY